MNIIYLITVFLMIILHILIYKKEEKQNLLKWIAITIMINFCYNIFICVILSFIKIKSTLITLSILNIIISIILGIKIYKDKKIQKYEINKIDIIALIIMFIIVVVTTIKQYGIPINITHEITDATVHYFVADEFYHYSELLFNGNSDILDMWHVDFFMPGAYINTGILFKIFSGFISETYFCQLYFIFDISIWFLSGILMYVFNLEEVNSVDINLINILQNKLTEIFLSCGSVGICGIGEKLKKKLGSRKDRLFYLKEEKEVFQYISI